MAVKVVPVALDRPAEVYREGASWKVEEERQGLHYVKIFDDKAQLLGQHLAQYVYSVSKVDDNSKLPDEPKGKNGNGLKTKSREGSQIRTHPGL